MYLNNTGMAGLADLDPVAAAKRDCREHANNTYQSCRANSTAGDGWQKCADNYAESLKGCQKIGARFNASGNNILDNMKSQGLDLSKLTVAAPTIDTLKPTVSPAVVNPSMSIVPAYSTTGLPISSFTSTGGYGTAMNPIRLGNVDPATGVDNTPEFWKGNNKYYTIAGAAVILGGIYYATTHKKGRRRK